MLSDYNGGQKTKSTAGPLVVIVGATASGKTDLAIEIAKLFKGEIICADSRTIYRDLNIGTAKPTPQQQHEVRHHLLDIIEPNQSFSAAQFKVLAEVTIEDITKRDRLPIIVGGTGLYIDAILFNYVFGPQADNKQRAELSSKTTEDLIQLCRQKNINLPINLKNKRHLIRALELGGLKQDPKILRSNTLVIGISRTKEELLRNSTQRAVAMVQAGLSQEVKYIGKKYGWHNESMTANAYRIFKRVVEGELSEELGIKALVKGDMQLAKRQITWFRRNQYIQWMQPDEAIQVVEHFLSHQNKARSA